MGAIRTIPLTQGRFAIVDEEDFERVSKHKWLLNGKYAGRFTGKQGERKLIAMHRYIIDAPDGVLVDHANRDTLDNRKCNLRLASRRENAVNCSGRKRMYSKFKGVTWHKKNNVWQACLGRRQYLGTFADEVEAAKAYDRAAKEKYGDFAFLNFPPK